MYTNYSHAAVHHSHLGTWVNLVSHVLRPNCVLLYLISWWDCRREVFWFGGLSVQNKPKEILLLSRGNQTHMWRPVTTASKAFPHQTTWRVSEDENEFSLKSFVKLTSNMSDVDRDTTSTADQ